MKRVGKLNGKPVVEGDANKIKNQILYTTSGGGIELKERKGNTLSNLTGSSGKCIYYDTVKMGTTCTYLTDRGLMYFFSYDEMVDTSGRIYAGMPLMAIMGEMGYGIMKINVVPIIIGQEGIYIEGQDIYEFFPKYYRFSKEAAGNTDIQDIDMTPLKECEITEEEYNKRKQQYLNG